MPTTYRIGRAADLPRNAAIQATVDDREVLVANVDGEVLATSARCRHQQAPLSEGQLVSRNSCAQIICAWHGWRYDLRTGDRLDRPGTPLDTYPVWTADGWIFLEDHP